MSFGSDSFKVRCPEPLYTMVKNFSVKTGRSFSDIIRVALREYLSRYEKEDEEKEIKQKP